MLVFKVWTENKWIIKENRQNDIITKYNRRVFPLNNIHKYILSGELPTNKKRNFFRTSYLKFCFIYSYSEFQLQ